jgi:sarcosine oxidase
VVGAGVFGLGTSIEAASRGLRVAIVDRESIPNPRAASFGASRKIKSTYADASYARLGLAAMRAWQRIERDAGEQLFVPLGNLVYSTVRDSPVVETQARQSEAAGGVVERLDEAMLRERFPQFRLAVSAAFEPAAGFLRATVAVAALVALARRVGVSVYEAMPVARLNLDAERPGAILVDGRALAGERLIVAAGAWSPRLVPQLRPLIRLQRVGNAYLTGLPASFDAGALPPFSVAETNFYGFPRWRTDRVKIGWHDGGEDTDDPETDRTTATPRFLDAVSRFLADHFGLALPASSVEGVSCMYDVTPTSDFLIDYVPGSRRVFAVTGGSGHGFKFGSIVGRMAMDRLEGSGDSWLPQFGWQAALQAPAASDSPNHANVSASAAATGSASAANDSASAAPKSGGIVR